MGVTRRCTPGGILRGRRRHQGVHLHLARLGVLLVERLQQPGQVLMGRRQQRLTAAAEAIGDAACPH